jgi:hypothetical protein
MARPLTYVLLLGSAIGPGCDNRSSPAAGPPPAGPPAATAAAGSAVARTREKLIGRWLRDVPGLAVEFGHDGSFRILAQTTDAEPWRLKDADDRRTFEVVDAETIKVHHGTADNPRSPAYNLYRLTWVADDAVELREDFPNGSTTMKLTRMK